MARRIEIELTSKRSESEWTWRAAGAKQPKGILTADVLYEGAKVGDVVKAEAEFEIDGITVLSVQPPAGKRAEVANRIDVVGPKRKFEPVTSQLAPKGRDRDRNKPGRRSEGGEAGKSRRPDSRSARPDSRSPRPDSRSDSRRQPRSEPRTRPAAPSFKRLAPKEIHRNAVLEQVSDAERPIAEKVLRGGIPSVRVAIDQENAKAKAEGRPEINSSALIALAEKLLPQLKAAEWMDKAEAAKAQVNEISVRDLRAVVAAADAVARSEEARLLAAELRDALDRRTKEARQTWLSDMSAALDENRTVRALNLSGRPPDPQVKIPSEVLERLQKSAEEALVPATRPDVWMKLLDSLLKSPVRRSVKSVALPEQPGDELLSAAKQAVGRVPALAAHLGMKVPPPPRPIPPKPTSPSPAKPAPSGAGENDG